MRIDPTIHDAIADGALTIDEFIAQLVPVWCDLERAALDQAAASATAAGFNPSDVRHVIEAKARELVASRDQRSATIRMMLEAGAINLQ